MKKFIWTYNFIQIGTILNEVRPKSGNLSIFLFLCFPQWNVSENNIRYQAILTTLPLLEEPPLPILSVDYVSGWWNWSFHRWLSACCYRLEHAWSMASVTWMENQMPIMDVWNVILLGTPQVSPKNWVILFPLFIDLCLCLKDLGYMLELDNT